MMGFLQWLRLLSLALLAGCATSTSTMAVALPLCDLRSAPWYPPVGQTAPTPGTHDPLEETQLLYGERVRVIKARDGWARIEAMEQPEFTHNKRWQGYPGWVLSTSLAPWEPLLIPNIVITQKWALTWQDAYLLSLSPWRFSMGTQLRAIDIGGHVWKIELLDGTTVWLPRQSARSLNELQALSTADKRALILSSALRLIGDPYFWGGRSPHATDLKDQITGVDCSGLVNLAYRVAGIDIPRDAHEQFLRAHPIATLKAADMIFLSERANPSKIVHVMLYAGENALIEAPGTGGVARRISVEQRLGHSLEHLTSGTIIDGQTVLFATYLP
jgi:cell wall-associated NlpC family hydrolase